MSRLLTLAAFALVLRYFAIQGGPLLSAQVSYDWTEATCAAKKIEVDKQPDPEGMKVLIDCLEETELPALLSRGERT